VNSLIISIVLNLLYITTAPFDEITEIHVQAVLTKYKVQYSIFEDLGATEFMVSHDIPNVVAILNRKAPASEFRFTMGNQRKFGPNPFAKRWVNMTPYQITGAKQSRVDLSLLDRAEPGVREQIRSAKYVERKYLGDDLKTHTGFELSILTGKGERHFEIFDRDAKRFILAVPLHTGAFNWVE
jgi:hypothetical protein